MRAAASGRRRTAAVTYTPTAYDALVLADSPVAFYSPAAGQALDLSGFSRNATIAGTVTTAAMPGGGDNAAVFDGTNYLQVADNDALSVVTTGVLTVEAWIRPDVVEFAHSEGTGYVHWLGKGEGSGGTGTHEWVARMYSLTNSEARPNRISGYAFNAAGGIGTGSYFQDAVTTGEWIHYTLVINTLNTSVAYPNGYTKVYKNGVQRDQDDLYSSAVIVPTNQSAPMRIGTRDLASFFQGAIGKVAIYNYEVTQPRLLAHVRALVPPVSAGTGAFVRTLGGVSSTTTGTGMTIAIPSGGVPVGDSVIVRLIHDYTVGGPTCVDTRGNTYTRDRTAANTSTTMRGSIWSAPVTTALLAGDAITVTLSAAVASKVMIASQYSGMVTTSTRIDQITGQAGTTTAPTLGVGITTTTANDILVAMCAVKGPDTDAFTEDATLGLYNQTARLGTQITGGFPRVNETFAGTEGSVVTSEAYCNFDGSFTTLTEHTSKGTNPSANWMMDTGTLTRKNGWGWTGKANLYPGGGNEFFFRCRTLTAKPLDTTYELDYKVASWASGTFGSNSTADGTALWFRYQTQWGSLYEVYIDKFDNKIGVKRKVPAIGYTGTGGVSNNGVYYTLKSDAACPVVGAGVLQATYSAVGSTNIVRDAADTTGVGGTVYHFKVTCKTIATNQVQFQIFRDGVLVWSATDNANDCISETNSVSLATDLANSRYNTADSRWNAATMANPIQVAGYSGMRTDNAQAYFDNVVITDDGYDSNLTLNAAFRSVSATGNYNYRPTLGTSREWIDFLVAYKAQ